MDRILRQAGETGVPISVLPHFRCISYLPGNFWYTSHLPFLVSNRGVPPEAPSPIPQKSFPCLRWDYKIILYRTSLTSRNSDNYHVLWACYFIITLVTHVLILIRLIRLRKLLRKKWDSSTSCNIKSFEILWMRGVKIFGKYSIRNSSVRIYTDKKKPQWWCSRKWTYSSLFITISNFRTKFKKVILW